MKQPSERDKNRFQRAMQALHGGDPREAIRLFEKVRKSWRDDPDIGYLQGLAYGKLGDYEAVMQVSKRALAQAPSHFGALCNLANVQFMMGDQESALENYGKALESQPDASEVLDSYGRALGMLGRRDEAIAHFKKALAHRSDYAPAHASLGRAYSEAGDPEAAMAEFRLALQLDPNDYGAHCGIAGLYTGAGGLDQAEFHFKEALRAEGWGLQAHLGLAQVERYKGDYQRAFELLTAAEIHTQTNDPRLKACKADCLERMGRTDEACQILNELRAQDNMPPVAVEVYAKLCHKAGTCDDALALIDRSAAAPATDSMEKQTLLYAAGARLDKLGRYDEAFDYYRRANEGVPVDIRVNYKEMYDRIIHGFSKENMAKLPRARTGSRRPIFILGMPRSGTSLTEHILSSHPDVYGAGELPDIKKLTIDIEQGDPGHPGFYAARMAGIDQETLTKLANKYLDNLNKLDSSAKFITDKMPHNFQHVGLISLLFPEARIIHCRRNPLDNGLSIYFQSFIWSHDYATDLANIGVFYSEYERLMRHWEQVIDIPMMTVQYEDMIADQEGMTRKLLEFCELEWDDSVLNFHDSKRAVATASYDQVRQPIYKTSHARWKNYARHIKPLVDSLPAHCVLGIEDIDLVINTLQPDNT